MVTWPSSKSPHMYHGTKQHERVGLITAAPKERQIWKHFVVYMGRNRQRNLHVFFTFPLTILSRNHSYHVTQPCSLVSLHNTIGVLRNFLSRRVRTLWFVFLHTLTSRLKAYALPNLAVVFSRVLNSIQLNDSRMGLSSVLITNKIYIVMVIHIVIS